VFFAHPPIAHLGSAFRANFATLFAKTAMRRKRYMAYGFFGLARDA
jgi:hypothetical protein